MIRTDKVTSRMREDKRAWEVSQLDHMSNGSSDLWKNIKRILKWKSGGPPNQLFYNGRLESSPKSLAPIMNNFFIEKIKKLQAKLQAPNEDPLRYIRKYMENKLCEFSLRIVHPDEVLQTLRSLNQLTVNLLVWMM